MKLAPFVTTLLLNCLLTLSASAQATQTPAPQSPGQKPAPAATEGEPKKNEVELALEEAKKHGEPILAACLQDCEEENILKGQALSLPQPAYPPIARAAHVAGTVKVHIIIDTEGIVIAAAAVEGHPLLQPACVAAARHARFSPTLYEGKPVKVTGVINYNFVAK